VSSSKCVRSITAGVVAIVLAAALPRAAEAQAQRRAPVHSGPSSPVVVVGGAWGPRYMFYGGYYPWAGWGYPYGWGYPGWGYPYGWAYPFGFGFGFGFSWGSPYGFYGPYPAYGYPAYGYPAYGYPGYGYGDVSLRVDVSQRDAEVFVDGYRAGVVDDFDGVLQRVHLSPGGHEITIYRQGFRTIKESLYLSPGGSQTMRYAMTPLGAGETAELPAPPSVTPRDSHEPRGRGSAPPEHLSERDRQVRPEHHEYPPAREAVTRFGSLSLLIQPADAEIFIDGAKWAAPGAASERTIIKLAEGRHKIEVKKAGYSTYTEDVLIRNSATLTLNVVLSR